MNYKMANYKYQQHITKITGCPPRQGRARTLAYRWVKNPTGPNDFLPPALKNPKRLKNCTTQNEACSSWALSMHDTIDASLDAYKNLQKTVVNIKKLFGDHIAEGFLTSNDGLITKSSQNGHFDFHEYTTSNVQSKFTLVLSIL